MFIPYTMNKISEYISNTISALKEVYNKPIQCLFSLGLSFLFLSLNILIFQFTQLGTLLIKEPSLYFKTYFYSLGNLPILSLMSTLTLSLLSSILIVMLIYGYRKNIAMNSQKGAAGASSGLVIGLLAPACPSCGIGLLSALGLGGLGTVLPFGGQEIGIIGILVLLVSIVYVSGQIVAPVCKLPRKRR